MTRKISGSLALFLLVLTAPIHAGSKNSFWAQTTFIKGAASCRTAGQGAASPLKLGMVLHQGDTVTVDKGGSVSFLLNDGSILVVRPETPVVLGEPARKSGPPLADVAKNLTQTLLARQGDNPMMKHIGGLRAEGKNIALAPTRTKVRMGKLVFVWLPKPPVQRFVFTLMGPDGMLYETTVSGTRTEVPPDKLAPGSTYYWEVRDAAIPDSVVTLGSGTFGTLDRNAEEKVRSLESTIAAAASQIKDADDFTASFLTYQISRENGLSLDALLALGPMIAGHPENEELLHWRSDLCKEMELDPADIPLLLSR